MTIGVKAIGELLGEFDGSDNTFWKWEEQVRMLQTAYQLDELATKVLMSTKLKGRAQNWLHSRPEYLTISVEELLGHMKVMFDHRPTKLALRRESEARK